MRFVHWLGRHMRPRCGTTPIDRVGTSRRTRVAAPALAASAPVSRRRVRRRRHPATQERAPSTLAAVASTAGILRRAANRTS
jgi:hypothetical protein